MKKDGQVTEIKQRLNQRERDYVLAKNLAAHLDELLGFQCEPVEERHLNSVNTAAETWQGLHPQSLQTPYTELLEMTRILPPARDLWVDLGAGYGRLGILLGFLFPDARFLGYECVGARVEEGRRVYRQWGLPEFSLQVADIAAENFAMPVAEVYFIYDFGSREDVYRVLEKLRLVAANKSIRVIARGRGVKNWILMDFPWLYVNHPVRHFSHWSLFQS